MNRETLEELGEHLKKHIAIKAGPRIGMILPQTFTSEGCDHTFKKTTEWLAANGLDVDTSLRWLKRHDAACDCQVLTNVIFRIDEEM